MIYSRNAVPDAVGESKQQELKHTHKKERTTLQEKTYEPAAKKRCHWEAAAELAPSIGTFRDSTLSSTGFHFRRYGQKGVR